MLPLLYQNNFLLLMSKNQITIFTNNLNFISRIENKVTIVQFGCTQNNASILLYFCRKSVAGIPINITNIDTTNGKIAQTYFENILGTNSKIFHNVCSMSPFLNHRNKIYLFSSELTKIKFFFFCLFLFEIRFNHRFRFRGFNTSSLIINNSF